MTYIFQLIIAGLILHLGKSISPTFMSGYISSFIVILFFASTGKKKEVEKEE